MGHEGEDLGDEALLYAGVLCWVLVMRFLGACCRFCGGLRAVCRI